ncbi:MAG: AlkA N-terminal domain-containing protein [Armatimonadota bacterium]
MQHESTALYQALASRDPRFDGVFFVGVLSTGIYCRPVCTARTPRAESCRFFTSAQAAEKEFFRPCLRCRPELAPGSAPVDSAHRIAAGLAHRLGEPLPEGEGGLEEVAAQFGLSARQVRRIIQREFGVSPIELLQSRRLLLAKQLLTETDLPVTEVAFASGFASVRRFNAAFSARYRMSPTRLRREAAGAGARESTQETLTLRMGYRPPFDWGSLLRFLDAHVLLGVEVVEGDSYLRTVRLGAHRGWVRVRNAPERRSLQVELSASLVPAIPALLERLRHLFDLCARPDLIHAHLGGDPRLAGSLDRRPGLRVPGAFDGFELAARTVLGQQVSVRAATTVAGRFAAAFGEPVETPHPALTRLSPTPERLARATVDEIASLGIIRARATSILALAAEVQAGRLRLDAGAPVEATVRQLKALPGIGDWTAQYVALRALRWPDAFPGSDLVIRRQLGNVTAAHAEALSQPWSPWRGYAALHLWESSADPRE